MYLCRHGLLKIYHVLCVTTVTLYSLALACVSTSPHKNKRFVLASCTALLLFLFITKLGRDNISNITNNVSIKKKILSFLVSLVWAKFCLTLVY